MRSKFRDEEQLLTQQLIEQEVERKRIESIASALAAGPETITWLDAGKHTLRLSVLGLIILGLNHQYSFLGDWLTASTTGPMLAIFLMFFGKSGNDFDWRGRCRLLCSFASVVAVLTLFNQVAMGVPIAETRDWLPFVLAINLGVWLLHDGIIWLVKRSPRMRR